MTLEDCIRYTKARQDMCDHVYSTLQRMEDYQTRVHRWHQEEVSVSRDGEGQDGGVRTDIDCHKNGQQLSLNKSKGGSARFSTTGSSTTTPAEQASRTRSESEITRSPASKARAEYNKKRHISNDRRQRGSSRNRRQTLPLDSTAPHETALEDLYKAPDPKTQQCCSMFFEKDAGLAAEVLAGFQGNCGLDRLIFLRSHLFLSTENLEKFSERLDARVEAYRAKYAVILPAAAEPAAVATETFVLDNPAFSSAGRLKKLRSSAGGPAVSPKGVTHQEGGRGSPQSDQNDPMAEVLRLHSKSGRRMGSTGGSGSGASEEKMGQDHDDPMAAVHKLQTKLVRLGSAKAAGTPAGGKNANIVTRGGRMKRCLSEGEQRAAEYAALASSLSNGLLPAQGDAGGDGERQIVVDWEDSTESL